MNISSFDIHSWFIGTHRISALLGECIGSQASENAILRTFVRWTARRWGVCPTLQRFMIRSGACACDIISPDGQKSIKQPILDVIGQMRWFFLVAPLSGRAYSVKLLGKAKSCWAYWAAA
jgi:hypothetical protein